MHATVLDMLHAHTTPPHSHHLPVDCYFILCVFYVSLHQNESKSDRLKMVWLKLMLTQVVGERERDRQWPLYYSIVIANKPALT
jgi:hypothetical protein